MTNNESLLHVLSQINATNRNKQLAIIFGTLAFLGVVGFTVYYVKYIKTADESLSYREKWLKERTDINTHIEAASNSSNANEKNQLQAEPLNGDSSIS